MRAARRWRQISLPGDNDLRVGWVGPSGELKGAKAEQVDGRSSLYLYKEQLPVRSCCQSGRRLVSATPWSDAEVVVFYVGDEKLHFQTHDFVGHSVNGFPSG